MNDHSIDSKRRTSAEYIEIPLGKQTPAKPPPVDNALQIIKKEQEKAGTKPPHVTGLEGQIAQVAQKVAKITSSVRLQFIRAFSSASVQAQYHNLLKKEDSGISTASQKVALLHLLTVLRNINKEVLKPGKEKEWAQKLKTLSQKIDSLRISKELEQNPIVSELKASSKNELIQNIFKNIFKTIEINKDYISSFEKLIDDPKNHSAIIAKIAQSYNTRSLPSQPKLFLDLFQLIKSEIIKQKQSQTNVENLTTLLHKVADDFINSIKAVENPRMLMPENEIDSLISEWKREIAAPPFFNATNATPSQKDAQGKIQKVLDAFSEYGIKKQNEKINKATPQFPLPDSVLQSIRIEMHSPEVRNKVTEMSKNNDSIEKQRDNLKQLKSILSKLPSTVEDDKREALSASILTLHEFGRLTQTIIDKTQSIISPSDEAFFVNASPTTNIQSDQAKAFAGFLWDVCRMLPPEKDPQTEIDSICQSVAASKFLIDPDKQAILAYVEKALDPQYQLSDKTLLILAEALERPRDEAELKNMIQQIISIPGASTEDVLSSVLKIIRSSAEMKAQGLLLDQQTSIYESHAPAYHEITEKQQLLFSREFAKASQEVQDLFKKIEELVGRDFAFHPSKKLAFLKILAIPDIFEAYKSCIQLAKDQQKTNQDNIDANIPVLVMPIFTSLRSHSDQVPENLFDTFSRLQFFIPHKLGVAILSQWITDSFMLSILKEQDLNETKSSHLERFFGGIRNGKRKASFESPEMQRFLEKNPGFVHTDDMYYKPAWSSSEDKKKFTIQFSLAASKSGGGILHTQFSEILDLSSLGELNDDSRKAVMKFIQLYLDALDTEKSIFNKVLDNFLQMGKWDSDLGRDLSFLAPLFQDSNRRTKLGSNLMQLTTEFSTRMGNKLVNALAHFGVSKSS